MNKANLIYVKSTRDAGMYLQRLGLQYIGQPGPIKKVKLDGNRHAWYYVLGIDEKGNAGEGEAYLVALDTLHSIDRYVLYVEYVRAGKFSGTFDQWLDSKASHRAWMRKMWEKSEGNPYQYQWTTMSGGMFDPNLPDWRPEEDREEYNP